MYVIPPIRGADKHGSGHYQAPRAGRLHNGIDIAVCAGTKIPTMLQATVTKIGYPYNPADPKKGHLRYLEIVIEGGLFVRYFYVTSFFAKGVQVNPGDILCVTQGLAGVYPGITDHFHFEVFNRDGLNGKRHYIDPVTFLDDIGMGF